MATKKPRTFPCQVWHLTDNYKVRKVTLVALSTWCLNAGCSASGKTFRSSVVFDTKAQAIKAGRKQIAKRLAHLDSVRKQIDAFSTSLDAAEAQVATR